MLAGNGKNTASRSIRVNEHEVFKWKLIQA